MQSNMVLNYYEVAKMCHDVYQYCPITNDCTGVAAKVSVVNNVLYVVFRGVDEWKDWKNNLNSQSHMWTTSNGVRFKIHQGFYHQWDSIRIPIIEQVRMRLKEYNIRCVCPVGFSSGGALASIACIELARLCRGIPISCITFGSPCVGDHDFVMHFDAKVDESTRFVNDNDPIPLFPLCYDPVPGLVRITNDSDQDVFGDRQCNDLPWYSKLWMVVGYLCSPSDWKDHDIAQYVKILKNSV